ncbi:uncharacterized protein LOC110028027 [Phalaenopsis equestris]|uniref:uncharacterized protein LOC110028027 n=1 Tax=Phalaenopsis equestris TaxID=78828 RepID=UPI0009E4C409|nr:uncharacterized protein LOC110028027 [Phalaenopsis equestris]
MIPTLTPTPIPTHTPAPTHIITPTSTPIAATTSSEEAYFASTRKESISSSYRIEPVDNTFYPPTQLIHAIKNIIRSKNISPSSLSMKHTPDVTLSGKAVITYEACLITFNIRRGYFRPTAQGMRFFVVPKEDRVEQVEQRSKSRGIRLSKYTDGHSHIQNASCG